MINVATFGKTNIGSTMRGAGANYAWGCKYTMPTYGEMTKITAYTKIVGGGNVVFGVYDETGKKLTQTNPVTISEIESWVDFLVSYVGAGKPYYFIMLTDGTSYIAADVGEIGQEVRDINVTYPNLPEQLEFEELLDNELSIYVTYTPIATPQVQLTISSTEGGTTLPTPTVYTVDIDSNVEVVAIPDSGFIFNHWELDGINVSADQTYIVIMDTNHTLHAVFNVILPTHTLTINSTPIQGVPFTLEEVVS